MKNTKNLEVKIIFLMTMLLFLVFLLVPIGTLLVKSLQDGSGFSLIHYRDMINSRGFGRALFNSFLVSGTGALTTTGIAFFLACTIHYTNVPAKLKKLIKTVCLLPMLLPTITYGFAIIYSFGKQGLFTRLLHHQLFNIYGFSGLLLGYVIYTLPVSFLLLCNTMEYIDKKFMVVSRVMGDSALSTFFITVLRPMMGTLAASFIQCFFLAFTDFGIPASVGGRYEVVAAVLYGEMLGSIPNFHNGAVVAMVMLIPSVVSVTVLHYLERYNIRYNKISPVELPDNKIRDFVCGGLSSVVVLLVLSLFAVIFIVPLVSGWPYDMSLTLDHFKTVFADPNLSGVYINSLWVALATAVFGTLISYGSALITARSSLAPSMKKVIEGIALVTNTIPGMVLGIAFMLVFTGTSLQNTFMILVLSNLIHFFSTPYLMMKNSLEKMNASWETTAKLMGDSWIKTICRIVTPNAMSTMVEVFSYYFINAMVTVSAVIFLAGARTMVITTKIKELQHFAKFNEIFVLSLCILFTNLLAKGLFAFLAARKKGVLS